MEIIKRLLWTGMILSLGLAATPASAVDTGWYGGLSFGEADVDVSGFDDSDESLKLFGGYNFNKYLALEGGFTDLGEFDLDLLPDTSVEVDGVQFVAVGNLPIHEKFSFFSKAGAYRWDADANILGISFGSDDGVDPTYGFGFRYHDENPYGGTLALRLEWERFDIDGDDVDLRSFSIVFSH